MVINRFCEVLYLSFARRPFALLIFFFRTFIYADHVRCLSGLGLHILYVFWVICFGHLFESSYFLLFPLFSVKNLLFLFYPHSVRLCLLGASVQSVFNHGWLNFLFVLESCLSIGYWCLLENGALRNAELLC